MCELRAAASQNPQPKLTSFLFPLYRLQIVEFVTKVSNSPCYVGICNPFTGKVNAPNVVVCWTEVAQESVLEFNAVMTTNLFFGRHLHSLCPLSHHPPISKELIGSHSIMVRENG